MIDYHIKHNNLTLKIESSFQEIEFTFLSSYSNFFQSNLEVLVKNAKCLSFFLLHDLISPTNYLLRIKFNLKGGKFRLRTMITYLILHLLLQSFCYLFFISSLSICEETLLQQSQTIFCNKE